MLTFIENKMMHNAGFAYSTVSYYHKLEDIVVVVARVVFV